jgi:L-threonylcarbamoyladenylate synthase
VSAIEPAVAALRRGELVVIPTDTVYGLACTAGSEQAARDLYRLKGRDAIQPTAVIFAGADALLEGVPGLGESAATAVRALLPGPYTLVVPNPEHRFAWVNAGRPDAVGVRVPRLPRVTAEIVAAVGSIVATSANLPGGPDPTRLSDVPEAIRGGVLVAVDGGELPGTPSTVLDLTGPEPAVLRVGAADPDDALRLIAAALG